jgi:hypothetical protein
MFKTIRFQEKENFLLKKIKGLLDEILYLVKTHI